MKKLIPIFLLTLLFIIGVQPAFAEEQVSEEVEYLDNGDYIVSSIEDEDDSNDFASDYFRSASHTVTKSKSSKYYNSSNKMLWYVKVTGTFTYNGSSASCKSVTPSATSSDSAWKVSSPTGSKSKNKASAATVARQYRSGKVINTVSKTVTLTCSPNGDFS